MELSINRVVLEMQNEELRKAEPELKALRDKYINLFNKVPVGYVVLKPTGMITDVNQIGVDMLGLKSRSLEVEIPLSRFIAPHHQERYYGHINALKKTGTRQGCNLEMVNLEGKSFRGQLTSAPEKDKTGQITLIRIAVTDITPVRKKRLYREARALSRLS